MPGSSTYGERTMANIRRRGLGTQFGPADAPVLLIFLSGLALFLMPRAPAILVNELDRMAKADMLLRSRKAGLPPP
jgi:hypothetical protein